MKKLLLIGSACALSALVFSGCTNTVPAHTTMKSSIGIGGKEDVLLRNNIVYRPVLKFAQNKVSAVGMSTNKLPVYDPAVTVPYLDPKVFENLSLEESVALQNAIVTACQKNAADILMEPTWTFEVNGDKVVKCTVVGIPVNITGYEKFTSIQVLQEYADFIKKNDFYFERPLSSRTTNEKGEVVEGPALDADGKVLTVKEMPLEDFMNFVRTAEFGYLGAKTVDKAALKLGKKQAVTVPVKEK